LVQYSPFRIRLRSLNCFFFKLEKPREYWARSGIFSIN
jgi:hypothetical protein